MFQYIEQIQWKSFDEDNLLIQYVFYLNDDFVADENIIIKSNDDDISNGEFKHLWLVVFNDDASDDKSNSGITLKNSAKASKSNNFGCSFGSRYLINLENEHFAIINIPVNFLALSHSMTIESEEYLRIVFDDDDRLIR
ncbi:hypothetical protein DERP_013589 [Dermatophagoides pteronyssinus]|uniref:Uncharacterized protein n=1 Tax=Dermatophagoides pteronyssinus TaxID=6956 RepID=A0ABQ8J5H0_DERPT|nr:hypothetical protein DERP_013589 [Dermatophagoides pteronyssinus]